MQPVCKVCGQSVRKVCGQSVRCKRWLLAEWRHTGTRLGSDRGQLQEATDF
jgi:hypothetical protein